MGSEGTGGQGNAASDRWKSVVAKRFPTFFQSDDGGTVGFVLYKIQDSADYPVFTRPITFR